VLARAEGAVYVHEPDNETHHPFALRAKAGLGRFPLLRPGDEAPPYAACWQGALAGGGWSTRNRRLRGLLLSRPYEEVEAWCDARRDSPLALRAIAGAARPGDPVEGGRPVVKSVHALLAAEWIHARWAPAVAVVRRQPLNVVASWLAASRGDARLSALEYSGEIERLLAPAALAAANGVPPAGDRLARISWLVGLLASARERLVARGGVVVVDHAHACRAPVAVLRGAAAALGLRWGGACDAALRRAERPGDTFSSAERIAAEQPDRWRSRLQAHEAERAERVLATFPGGPGFGSAAP
jgi:hypothetical protein